MNVEQLQAQHNMAHDAAQQFNDDTVKQLLDQARSALHASNAPSALQCVVQALKLLRGDSAVLPILRNAAAQYQAQQTAPIEEISSLLSQVTLQAEQQHPQQQQHPGWGPSVPQQHTQQYQQQLPTLKPPGQQHHQQHYQQQQMATVQSMQHHHCSAPILDETGRGDITGLALQDGSFWQCPHCAGVVPLLRQQVHLDTWCPVLHANNSDDMC